MDIEISIAIPVLALIAAFLSALYSRWSASQAKRANDIGRLNALLALRVHYTQLIENQYQHAKVLQGNSSGMHAIQISVADMDIKLREVNEQINNYHNKVVENKI